MRPAGAGSRAEWGGADDPAAVELSTPPGWTGSSRTTPATSPRSLEAGVPLADRAAPPGRAPASGWPSTRPTAAAPIGGLVATADSGPARHRYGGVRDLVIGITVVLSDGTVARSGGTVIKNVAGYDLGKLFTGSYGTLGLVTEVAVRLHPLPARTATVVGATDDPERLAAARAGRWPAARWRR